MNDKEMKDFLQNQIKFFQFALKHLLSLGKNDGADHDKYAKLRSQAEEEVFEIAAKQISDSTAELKKIISKIK